MIVGQHTRDNDLEVNVLKGKKLTNIRTHSKDEAVRLTPPIQMTLEKALAYIQDDELVEVTPKSIRLRKGAARPERPQARRSGEGGGGSGVAFSSIPSSRPTIMVYPSAESSASMPLMIPAKSAPL